MLNFLLSQNAFTIAKAKYACISRKSDKTEISIPNYENQDIHFSCEPLDDGFKIEQDFNKMNISKAFRQNNVEKFLNEMYTEIINWIKQNILNKTYSTNKNFYYILKFLYLQTNDQIFREFPYTIADILMQHALFELLNECKTETKYNIKKFDELLSNLLNEIQTLQVDDDKIPFQIYFVTSFEKLKKRKLDDLHQCIKSLKVPCPDGSMRRIF
jgi:hypothetical protein